MTRVGRDVSREAGHRRVQILDVIQDRVSSRVYWHGITVLTAEDPIGITSGDENGTFEVGCGSGETAKGEEDTLGDYTRRRVR